MQFLKNSPSDQTQFNQALKQSTNELLAIQQLDQDLNPELTIIQSYTDLLIHLNQNLIELNNTAFNKDHNYPFDMTLNLSEFTASLLDTTWPSLTLNRIPKETLFSKKKGKQEKTFLDLGDFIRLKVEPPPYIPTLFQDNLKVGQVNLKNHLAVFLNTLIKGDPISFNTQTFENSIPQQILKNLGLIPSAEPLPKYLSIKDSFMKDNFFPQANSTGLTNQMVQSILNDQNSLFLKDYTEGLSNTIQINSNGWFDKFSNNLKNDRSLLNQLNQTITIYNSYFFTQVKHILDDVGITKIRDQAIKDNNLDLFNDQFWVFIKNFHFIDFKKIPPFCQMLAIILQSIILKS